MTDFPRREYIEELRSLIDRGSSIILLVGAAGLGKTTIMHQLARHLATSDLSVLSVGPRPLHDERELAAMVARELRVALADESLDSSVEAIVRAIRSSEKRFVLLLDGLDEVYTPHRFIEAVKQLASATTGQLVTVISSRPATFLDHLSGLAGASTVTLATFGEQESLDFIKKHIPGVSDEVANEIAATSQGNPLYLTFVANLVNEGQEWQLPSIDEAAEQFLEKTLRNSADPHLTKRALELVASFEPVSPSFLAETLGVSLTSVRDILNTLSAVTTTPRQDAKQEVVIVHSLIRDWIVRRSHVLDDIEISRLDFGAEEAERDIFLDSGFLRVHSIEDIISAKKTIVIGDRGAGKSSIARFIEKSGDQEHRLSDATPLVSVSDQHLDFVSKHLPSSDSGGGSADHFKAVWLLYVAAVAATHLQTRAPKAYAKEARELLLSLRWGHRVNEQPSRARRIWQAVKSRILGRMKFKVGPITLEPDWSSAGQPIDVTSFLEATNEALRSAGLRLLVVFDQVDQLFKYERNRQEQVVQGLFLAESLITHWEGGLRIAVLLRTDLFEVYDIQEKNKLVSRTQILEWSDDDLIDLLVKRVFANQAIAGVADLVGDSIPAALRAMFPTQMEGSAFQSWFLRSLRNGAGRVSPRQVVLFLILVQKQAVDADMKVTAFPVFDEYVVSAAMTELSRISFDEVLNDFRIAPTLVRNCRAAGLLTFGAESVRELFNEDEGDLNKQLELLERLGFVSRGSTTQGGRLSVQYSIPALYTRCWNDRARSTVESVTA